MAQATPQRDRFDEVNVQHILGVFTDTIRFSFETRTGPEVVGMQANKQLTGFRQRIVVHQFGNGSNIREIGCECFKTASISEQFTLRIEPVHPIVFLTRNEPDTAEVSIVGWNTTDVDTLRLPVRAEDEFFFLDFRPAGDIVYRSTGETVRRGVIPAHDDGSGADPAGCGFAQQIPIHTPTRAAGNDQRWSIFFE